MGVLNQQLDNLIKNLDCRLDFYKSVLDSADSSMRLRGVYSALPAAPSKGQIISKANFLVLIWTKNRTNYILISALASKRGRIKK